jgi:hypothetical protein
MAEIKSDDRAYIVPTLLKNTEKSCEGAGNVSSCNLYDYDPYDI